MKTEFSSPLPYIIISLIIGLTAEIIALFLQLWRFTPRWYFFIQVCLWEGLLYGLIAWSTREKGLIVQVLVGVVPGFLAEFINLRSLHLWDFNMKLFSNDIIILLVVSILWALYVPITVSIVRILNRNV